MKDADIKALTWQVKRRCSRLAVVQMMYKIRISEQDNPANFLKKQDPLLLLHEISTIIKESIDDQLTPDKELFLQIMSALKEDYDHYNLIITQYIPKDSVIEKMDILTHIILITGVAEIISSSKTPPEVIIKEYQKISSSFLDPKAVTFIHAIIDKVIKNKE